MITGVWQTQAPAETQSRAAMLAAQLRAGDNLLFYGELGSGKTTFIQGLVGYFEAKVEVTSPSYSLIHHYPTTPAVYHVDLYRLSENSQLADLGLDELFSAEGIVLIEWAERLGDDLPVRYFKVELEILSLTERRLSVDEVSHVAGG